ncbi:MAG: [FeFe] hydrogenase H-cluster maturation GTPase HydF [Synergistaceae bacterium]|jgi:[FeFe] hydrogenase H-cluster maturation GTPase HydF|nr:[FeFe] hydrogenase H-cluster maturation GTPase HydF [Synergistaceae bacterium]
MGLNDTPSSERVHIGIFGMRNAGKSSLLNAIAGQPLAVVSETAGTTTDPVRKSMELLPVGPVLLIDTPGIDDAGELGEKRVEKARQVLRQTDAAVLVVDSRLGKSAHDLELLRAFDSAGVPHVTAFSKCDLLEDRPGIAKDEIFVSAETGENIEALKERIAAAVRTEGEKLRIVGDLLHPADFAVLVVPIDASAPKGRLILPQQQTIRDILEADAAAVVVKEFELRETLESLGKRPALVITDSQVFAKVSADTPPDMPLTSFSILMARYKGLLDASVRGVLELDMISDGDKILIAEGCTHHRQCDDIGTVKLPRWIRQHTGKKPEFEFTSGGGFPDDLSPYSLIVHCGGCMINGREMKYRQREAASQGVPITNFGVLIAHMQGILKRCVSIFPHLSAEFEE